MACDLVKFFKDFVLLDNFLKCGVVDVDSVNPDRHA